MEVLVLSVGLAADAAAAAAGIGATERSWVPLLTAAGLFGLFQAGMSGVGWWGGLGVAAWASAWDHWIAFFLLAGLGGRTIREGWRAEESEPVARGLGALLVLAFATSVDALAAGITLPAMGVTAATAVGTIGVTTAVLSLAAGILGRSLGSRFGSRFEVLGGLALVGLGFKILLSHTILS